MVLKSKIGLMIIVVILLVLFFVSGIFVGWQYLASRSDNPYITEYGIFIPDSRNYDYALYAQTKIHDTVTNALYSDPSNSLIFIQIDNKSDNLRIVQKISSECFKASLNSSQFDSDKCRNELLNMYIAIK